MLPFFKKSPPPVEPITSQNSSVNNTLGGREHVRFFNMIVKNNPWGCDRNKLLAYRTATINLVSESSSLDIWADGAECGMGLGPSDADIKEYQTHEAELDKFARDLEECSKIQFK